MTHPATSPTEGEATHMQIEELKTDTIVIRGATALDPVTVVFRDEGPARGGIVVECYGMAWAAFWGGMGSKTVREFVASVDADYVANKLWRTGDKRTKQAEAYLLRIATAIIEGLRAAQKAAEERERFRAYNDPTSH